MRGGARDYPRTRGPPDESEQLQRTPATQHVAYSYSRRASLPLPLFADCAKCRKEAANGLLRARSDKCYRFGQAE